MNNATGGYVYDYEKQIGDHLLPKKLQKWVDEYMGEHHPWVFAN